MDLGGHGRRHKGKYSHGNIHLIEIDANGLLAVLGKEGTRLATCVSLARRAAAKLVPNTVATRATVSATNPPMARLYLRIIELERSASSLARMASS